MKLDIRNVVIAILAVVLVVLILNKCNRTDKKVEAIQEKYNTQDSSYILLLQKARLKVDSFARRIDSMQNLAVNQKETIKQIPVKYETVLNDIRKLPADKQLSLFSNWLSQIRDTER